MASAAPGMSPEEVGERLVEATRERDARRGRRPPADMGAEAVGRRLRRVAELRDLCLALGRARPLRFDPQSG